MKVELQFKDRKVLADLPGHPRQGEFVRWESFDKDLCIKRIVWTQARVIFELEDPLHGHDYVCDPDDPSNWHCRRCNMMFMCYFSPGHSQWPEHEDCDVQIARSLHAE